MVPRERSQAPGPLATADADSAHLPLGHFGHRQIPAKGGLNVKCAALHTPAKHMCSTVVWQSRTAVLHPGPGKAAGWRHG